MSKQDEIREGRLLILQEWGIDGRVEILKDLEKFDHSQGVVIRGDSLGGTHPHLASYFTVIPLIGE